MKTVSEKAKTETAYGQTLPSPLSYEYEFSAYESYDEAKDAGDLLSHDEILTAVNNKRKAAARQKKLNEVLEAAGYSKPTLEDPQVQLKTMIKVFIAAGRSEAEATKLAQDALGVTLA